MSILNIHGEFESDEPPKLMKLRHDDAIAVRRGRPRNVRLCAECGRPFAGRSDKRYCCESCRRRAAKRREHKRSKAE